MTFKFQHGTVNGVEEYDMANYYYHTIDQSRVNSFGDNLPFKQFEKYCWKPHTALQVFQQIFDLYKLFQPEFRNKIKQDIWLSFISPWP